MDKLRIGIVGIGKISGIYLQNLTGMFGKRVILSAVTDLIPERAEKAAEEYKTRYIKGIDELINDPSVDIILNITQPQKHFQVAMTAVKAGKHVYDEKPLCVTREEAQELLKTAAASKVRVGGAPDTFLGAGIQTCRKLIDDGWIGKPIAATAFMMNHGHEHWHPDPEFYYKAGAGPMFDMGPYYLTALVNLLGPITRVSGSAQQGFKTRTITSEPQNGKIINVDVPTHIAGVLDFANGAVGTIITSFDVWASSMPFIEIYGTEGTLQVPDPNYFGGPVKVRRFQAEEWSEVPLLKGFPENSRGLGITDMAEAIVEGRPHRASGELAYHVLEVMHGIHDASASGIYYQLKSTCVQPEIMK
ncbi:Gfo/Idh/MocA family protein [Treponema primitia]|uniref:Gfo/Idh/MocA family protein n=1 Tax=Treponema primitia TaxID=88058 RepID=UPI00025550D3|nr:Gfo/Idh/MocA family oxidoreductase [Treponema primitia]